MTDATIIATIRKNAAEEIRVSLTTFKEHELVDLRVYADMDGKSERQPTRKGISCHVSKISALIEALENAQAEAVRRNLFSPKPDEPRRPRWWDS